jgi:hypothetical protein
MSDKLLMRLAPLVVVAAFVVMPAAAQAAPHFFVNEEGISAGSKVHVLAWGSLTLTPEGIALAPTTCENAAGGFAENPEGPLGAAPGRGATEDFASWNCANGACPPGEVEYPPGSSKKAEKEFIVFPGGKEYAKQSLPWPTVLTEAVKGQIRLEATGVIVDLACVAAHVSEQGPPFGGDTDHDTPAFLAAPTVCVTEPGKAKQEPLAKNGTQIGGPLTGTLVFDPGAGKLSCVTEVEKKPVGFKGNTEGVLKTFGYEGQDLIKSK